MGTLWEDDRFIAIEADAMFAVVEQTRDGLKQRGFFRGWSEKQTGRRFFQDKASGKVFELTLANRLNEVTDPSLLRALDGPQGCS
jgi:hypothetical protein